MTVPPDDGLDALSTEQLRERAFALAERRRDVGFFWDLIRHAPAATAVAAEDGSSGHITGGIVEAVETVREILGKDLGDFEPLFRARFLDYLRSAG